MKNHTGITDVFVVTVQLLAAAFTLSAVSVPEAEGNQKQTQSASKPTVSVLPDRVPTPADNPTTPAKVALGKQLFFDPRLSGDNSMSCATCHLPNKGFVDGLPRAKGAGGKQLSRNTQTLIDVGFHSAYFWDGRANSLEEQALGPIESPVEMNQNLDELVAELGAISSYVEQFETVFGTGVTTTGIAKSLAAFQRTLVARNSPFDRYLAGDKKALSQRAVDGMKLFLGRADCVRCHNGPLLSDGKYYRLGVDFVDKGRGAVTGKKDDWYKFRTPSLRNIAQTAPYMHNGSEASLFDVVEFYFRGAPAVGPGSLAVDIEPLVGESYSDIDAIVEFLKSLSGTVPEVEPPVLP